MCRLGRQRDARRAAQPPGRAALPHQRGPLDQRRLSRLGNVDRQLEVAQFGASVVAVDDDTAVPKRGVGCDSRRLLILAVLAVLGTARRLVGRRLRPRLEVPAAALVAPHVGFEAGHEERPGRHVRDALDELDAIVQDRHDEHPGQLDVRDVARIGEARREQMAGEPRGVEAETSAAESDLRSGGHGGGHGRRRSTRKLFRNRIFGSEEADSSAVHESPGRPEGPLSSRWNQLSSGRVSRPRPRRR